MAFAYLPGLGLTDAQLEAFAKYRDFLAEWNTKVNLTAITEPKEVEIKHFLDSLLLRGCRIWQACRKDMARPLKIADVGGGAGFPGIPMKIVEHDLILDIIEASEKKSRFIQALAGELELKDVRAIHIRAEEAGQDPACRERYDWAFCRGVAAMPALLELCLPLIRVGGYLAAYKGPAGQEEAEAGEKAAALLGGVLAEAASATLPEGMGGRCLLIYEKTESTPRKYPRRAGIPAKQPIL